MWKIFKNIINAIKIWIYYRLGWIRASLLGVQVDWHAKISPHAEIYGVSSIGRVIIGRDVVVGIGSYVASGIIQVGKIGKYCSIGPEVLIGLTEHRLDHWTTSPNESRDNGEVSGLTDKPIKYVIIGNGVWLGARVTIIQGVTIGNRAVIAAGAVVTRNVPPDELWGGVPAKKIKKLR